MSTPYSSLSISPVRRLTGCLATVRLTHSTPLTNRDTTPGVVRDQQDGEAAGQLHQQLVELGRGRAVHAGRGLVQQQQLGMGGQGAGDEHPLPLPAGQGGEGAPAQLGQPDGGQRLLGRLPVLSAVRAGREVAHPAHAHHVQDGDREQGVEAGVLGHVAHPAAGPLRRPAEHPHLAGLRARGAQDQAQQGGLAAPVGAHRGDELSGQHLEADLLEHRLAGVGEVHPPELDHRERCGGARRAGRAGGWGVAHGVARASWTLRLMSRRLAR